MRLENIENRTETKKNDFIVARHGEDIPRLTKDLNENLLQETVPLIKELGENISNYYLNNKNEFPKGIRIFHSSKSRTKQTAVLLERDLKKKNISVEKISDPALQEIYQGNFKIDSELANNEIYPPLKEAWGAFIEAIKNGDLLYRFGDPKFDENNKAKYSKLAEYFHTYGENQIEFSVRIYRFLKEFLKMPDDKLNIIITHQAIASRIQRIINALENIIEDDVVSKETFLIGDLEQSQTRKNLQFAEGVVVRAQNREKIIKLLEREISYLEKLSTLVAIQDEKNNNLSSETR